MGTAQVIMVVLLTLAVAANIVGHNKTYTRNAWWLCLHLPVLVAVLHMGGYWAAIKAPQIITIILMTFNCTVAVALNGKEARRNGLVTLIDTGLIVALYWWGGFWG